MQALISLHEVTLMTDIRLNTIAIVPPVKGCLAHDCLRRNKKHQTRSHLFAAGLAVSEAGFLFVARLPALKTSETESR